MGLLLIQQNKVGEIHGRTWLSAVSVHAASQDISTSPVVSVLHFFFFVCLLVFSSPFTSMNFNANSCSGLIGATNIEIPQMKCKHQEMAEVSEASHDPLRSLVTLLASIFTLRDWSWSSSLFWTDWGNPGLSVSDTSANQVYYSICHRLQSNTNLPCIGQLFLMQVLCCGYSTAYPALLFLLDIRPREEPLPSLFYLQLSGGSGSCLSDAQGPLPQVVSCCVGLLWIFSVCGPRIKLTSM